MLPTPISNCKQNNSSIPAQGYPRLEAILGRAMTQWQWQTSVLTAANTARPHNNAAIAANARIASRPCSSEGQRAAATIRGTSGSAMCGRYCAATCV